MKKRNLASSLLLLIFTLTTLAALTGCAPSYRDGDDYIWGQDFQFSFAIQGNRRSLAESESGYYLLSGEYLYYADKETMRPVILCGRPNCRHNEETSEDTGPLCHAFVHTGMASAYITFFDGALYVLSDSFSLTQVSEIIIVNKEFSS